MIIFPVCVCARVINRNDYYFVISCNLFPLSCTLSSLFFISFLFFLYVLYRLGFQYFISSVYDFLLLEIFYFCLSEAISID